jgi:Zn-dependent metalloprotease
VYGDGDRRIFGPFTKALDVIGHELTHDITQYEAGLNYRGQSGALNESFSDVFGSLLKQYKKRQTAAELYCVHSLEQKAVREAWSEVGV